jgi:hypothetical protein
LRFSSAVCAPSTLLTSKFASLNCCSTARAAPISASSFAAFAAAAAAATFDSFGALFGAFFPAHAARASLFAFAVAALSFSEETFRSASCSFFICARRRRSSAATRPSISSMLFFPVL